MLSKEYEATTFILLAFIAILSRFAALIGHLPNFSVANATALFCGVYFVRRSNAIAFVLITLWLSDLAVNRWLTGHWTLFYSGWYWQYASYAFITLIGSTLTSQITPYKVFTSSIASSLLFFLLSNFGVWYEGLLYPHTMEGLINCYVAALPFFRNTFFSDLFFTFIFFGIIEWTVNRIHLTHAT